MAWALLSPPSHTGILKKTNSEIIAPSPEVSPTRPANLPPAAATEKSDSTAVNIVVHAADPTAKKHRRSKSPGIVVGTFG